jgi:hypothetical protein
MKARRIRQNDGYDIDHDDSGLFDRMLLMGDIYSTVGVCLIPLIIVFGLLNTKRLQERVHSKMQKLKSIKL